jgi:hypothetical protein
MRFNGGLSNVTRQYVGDALLSRICGDFVTGVVLSFEVVFIVAFIGASYSNHSSNGESLRPALKSR